MPERKMEENKRRTCSALPELKFSKAEGEEEFLSQVGAGTMLREALLKLLQSRPEDPVGFLADHFESLVLCSEGGGEDQEKQLLERVLWHLRLAHYSQRSAFNNNVSVAFEIISAGTKRRVRPGLKGRTYIELLSKICRDGKMPEQLYLRLIKKIHCQDHEAVPFEVFRYGVLTSLVFLDFITKSGSLFEVLTDSEKADKRLCDTVLAALEDAMTASDITAPTSYLEAGSKLGPDSLALAMDRSMTNNRAGSSMKREEFVRSAAVLFLTKVRHIS
ncbi:tubulin polyglutamylase complex subunit 1 isoform X2 [Latimeria chalumnae]|uniref:Tubulin polyglutamylase complex subunit 1 n=1 Tax=Latimeria chalumnae TaxID=7897 RepID=H3ACF8_LATCH|nr:PREDICTED: tubulin polyglutamylase complex subunit 1 isoform X2 [Latimeria chalumnae]|eukprot:XP_005999535.1 PREDICTED: tubulin polyglutamylase complex subunit 1 isoform X2 [Latimeria chalumnae]